MSKEKELKLTITEKDIDFKCRGPVIGMINLCVSLNKAPENIIGEK